MYKSLHIMTNMARSLTAGTLKHQTSLLKQVSPIIPILQRRETTLQPCNVILQSGQTEILKCESSKELLAVASRKTQDWQFDPADFVTIFSHLAHIVYTKELNRLPWLHGNRVTAFEQLNFIGGNELHSCTQGPELDQLLSSLQSNVAKLPTEKLTQIFSSVIYLGVSPSNPACVAILNKLLDKDTIFGWNDFQYFMPVHDYCGNTFVIMSRYMLPKFKKLVNDSGLEGQSREMLLSMFAFLYYGRRYMSKKETISVKCTKKLVSLISEDEIFQHWDISLGALDVLSYSFSHYDYVNLGYSLPVMKELCVKVMENLLEHVDDIPVHLYSVVMLRCANICSDFFRYDNEQIMSVTEDIDKAIYRKSLEIFEKDDYSIAELTYIIYSLLKYESVSERLEKILLNRLKEADSFLLVSIAHSFNKMFPLQGIMTSKKLAEEFKNQFQRCFDLVGYDRKSRMTKFLQFNSKDKSFAEDFTPKLSNFLQDHVITNRETFKTASIIISLSYDHNPPDFVISRLIKAIPHVNINGISHLMNSFERMFHARRKKFYPYYGIINEAAISHLKAMIKKEPSLSLVLKSLETIYLLRSLPLRPEVECLREFLEILPKVAECLSAFEFDWLVHSLKGLRYFNEDLFQILERFFVENKQNMTFRQLHNLTFIMCYTEYDVKSQEFEAACMEVLDKQFENRSCAEQICLLDFLMGIQIYPERYIMKIFSLEYLKSLDVWFEENKGSTVYKNTRSRLVYMNRNAVLGCPHLSIPWLMEGLMPYENRLNPSENTQSNSEYGTKGVKFDERQVISILQEILGGSDFYKWRVKLPYYYTADYELYLDKQMNPVNYNEAKESNDSSLQRVAILLLSDREFCFNSRRVIGRIKQKARHLEQLGFKVIQVPIYEWNSMEYSSDESKKNYLRKKIFSS